MGSQERAGSNALIYRASKAAATNLARSLAIELAPRSIAVGAYHPGWVRTDMGGPSADVSPQESAAGLLARFDNLNMTNTGIYESLTAVKNCHFSFNIFGSLQLNLTTYNSIASANALAPQNRERINRLLKNIIKSPAA